MKLYRKSVKIHLCSNYYSQEERGRKDALQNMLKLVSISLQLIDFRFGAYDENIPLTMLGSAAAR